MRKHFFVHRVCAVAVFLTTACNQTDAPPDQLLIKEMNLKRGDIISCSPAGNEFGTLAFEVTGKEEIKDDFALGLKLLHSFEYDEAEKVFAGIIDKDPQCAMAYWGVAMSNFHPLWSPPSEAELKKGATAIRIAQSINNKTKREAAYLATAAAYYNNYATTDHRSRCLQFEKAAQQLSASYPADKEAAVFYALALTAAADPADKTFARQKKAGQLLNSLYPSQPDHPGIIHYLIHTYDSPELAELGLPAARKYASVAPSSAHALHMPSHIFTRLGLWDECIESNKASVTSAQCYATAAGIKGHWDEELHGLDYLVYAYLQKGQNALAQQQLAYIDSMKEINPANFKVAYAFAAIPSRYVLENKRWPEAADLALPQKNFSWDAFPWQKAIIHFTRLLGAAHTGNKEGMAREEAELERLHTVLLQQKNNYQAAQVAIQLATGRAWRLLHEGKEKEALAQMKEAATLEDKTEKHPVTPGEVLPARELLGDMLLQLNKPAAALQAYEQNLQKHRNRFNGLYGAALAAEKTGNTETAKKYYRQLLAVTDAATAARPELLHAKAYLQ